MDRIPDTSLKRIASRYPSYYLRGYARGKLKSDPVYEAVHQRVSASPMPILDIGCGIGLCALYLRARGYQPPIHGIDPDSTKIEAAQGATSDDPDLTFEVGEADPQSLPPIHGHVLMLDVLHYLNESAQREVLQHLAEQVPAGGWCILRATPRDQSWRFRMTQWEERFARAIGWMRREAVTFPTREAIVAPFENRNFSTQVRPLWGRTPFNSYLFAFQRQP